MSIKLTWKNPVVQADEIRVYRALRDEGIARWLAGIFYIGVRIGAENAFEGVTT